MVQKWVRPKNGVKAVHFEDTSLTPYPRVRIRRASSLQSDDVSELKNFSRRVAPILSRRSSLPRIDGNFINLRRHF